MHSSEVSQPDAAKSSGRIPPSCFLIRCPPPHPSCSQSTDQACQPQSNCVSDISCTLYLSPELSISQMHASDLSQFFPSSSLFTLGINIHSCFCPVLPLFPSQSHNPSSFSFFPLTSPPTCFLSDPGLLASHSLRRPACPRLASFCFMTELECQGRSLGSAP